jgi:hypothetical protein
MRRIDGKLKEQATGVLAEMVLSIFEVMQVGPRNVVFSGVTAIIAAPKERINMSLGADQCLT